MKEVALREELSTKESYWYNHILKQRENGDTRNEYGIKHGIGKKSLYRWEKHFIQKGIIRSEIKARHKSKFQSVQIIKTSPRPESGVIRIHFPNGLILEMQGEISSERLAIMISNWI
ncbi:MAG: hypothetical protein ACD_79C00206G0001 [uncultured bacterium]|nr:MAG: hypothetical protein ACD_79C00206G0001 [uncultured bacterium]